MIDTYCLKRNIRDLQDTLKKLLPIGDYSDICGKEIAAVLDSIDWLECEEDHCEDTPEDPVVTDLGRIIDRKLRRMRLGVYDESMEGNLQEVLEDFEKVLEGR